MRRLLAATAAVVLMGGPETALEPPREERKRAIPVKTKERKRRI